MFPEARTADSFVPCDEKPTDRAGRVLLDAFVAGVAEGRSGGSSSRTINFHPLEYSVGRAETRERFTWASPATVHTRLSEVH